MTKHRWKESVKSFFGSHVDPEKDEELKGVKTEIEEKVQKTLMLLKDVDEEDATTVGNIKKDSLVDLIEDFHKHYQSLYASYDNLIGELRQKVCGNQEKDTSSSSSESDSDYSPNSKRSKNGKAENFQKLTDSIQKELETANIEIADLRRKLAAAIEEKYSSHLEYLAVLNKVQDAGKIIEELRIESGDLYNEKSNLLVENEDLKLKLDTVNKLEAELYQKLDDVYREKDSLLLEREALMNGFEEEKRTTEEMIVMSNQLKHEKEAQQIELEAVKDELLTVKTQLESALKEVSNVRRAYKAAEEENISLSSKVLQFSDEISQKHDKIQELVTESSHLRVKLTEKEEELSDHVEMHEAYKGEASTLMKGLELEMDSLHGQRREIEKQKDNELLVLLKKLEDSEKESLSQIEDLRAQLNGLQGEVKFLYVQKGELEEHIVTKGNETACKVKELMHQANEKLQEVECANKKKSELETLMEEKVNDLTAYIIQIETLKVELANKTTDQQRMLEENEGLIIQVKDLELEMERHLKSRDHVITELQKEKEGMQDKFFEMERTISERENEISAMKKKLEDEESKASAQIMTLMEELDASRKEKIQSELHLDKKNRELSEWLVQIENLKEEASNKDTREKNLLEEKEILMMQVKDLELQVHALVNQKGELEEQISLKNCEYNNLREEKEGLCGRISELDKILIERGDQLSSLQKKLEDIQDELSVMAELQKEKEGLQDKIFEMERTVSKRENEISAMQKKLEDEENKASEQIMALMEELCTSRKEKTQSELHLEQKNQELSEWLVQIENLKEEASNQAVSAKSVLEEKKGLRMQVKDLELQMHTLCNQKGELEGQISLKNCEFNNLREEKDGLHARISELEKTLAESEDGLCVVQKKLEDVENETSAQIASLSKQVNSLHEELNSLHAEKHQLEVQIETGRLEFSERLTQMENEKMDLAIKTMDQERILSEREEAMNKLSEDHKQLEVLFQECKQNLQVAEKRIADMEEEFHKVIESRDCKIDELEERIEDMRRDLEIKGDEVSTLVENVRTIEVKLRLSNQKLRVTEQLLTEKEESHKNKEGKLQQENEWFKEKVLTLSGIIDRYKEAQYKMTTEIPERFNNTLIGMDALTMKFEEDYGHFETCVYDIFNELMVAKNWVMETKREKQTLKQEVGHLRKEIQSRTENESVVREKIGELEAKIGGLELSLLKDEDDKRSLVKVVKQLEKRMEKLQKIINDKDEGIAGLCEEKKEVIRQLCIWIDYHRSRCDNLKEIISKTTGRRRQVTT